MKIPDIFRIRRASTGTNSFPLNHNHISTTDFFRVQPTLCRELVPHDKGNIAIDSVVRFFPMPFPTYASIKYNSRAFFVPYRTIMRGWNEFINRTPYVASNGQSYTIASVPSIANSVLCNMFARNEYSTAISDKYYLVDFRLGADVYRVLSDYLGHPIGFVDGADVWYFAFCNDNYFGDTSTRVKPLHYTSSSSPSSLAYIVHQDASDTGTFTDQSSETYPRAYELTNGSGWPVLEFLGLSDSILGRLFKYNSLDPYTEQYTEDEFPSRDSVSFDFIDLLSQPRRFNNNGRYFYQLLCSLGYRVDFSLNSDGDNWNNSEVYSAGKLLAYMKVWLDYYAPSNYDWSQYYKIFQKESSHLYLTYNDISDIVKMFFVSYDRDYFTSAWQHPNGPNGSSGTSVNRIPDINGFPNNGNVQNVVESGITNPNFFEGAPNIHGANASGENRQSPVAITQYIINALSLMQQYVHRHQLAGYRAIDRYFARFGIKLSDDRSNRAYYLGGYDYYATIKDQMSTAETKEGVLGDYAGKAMAYSDNEGGNRYNFNYDVDEYGFLIIMHSVVPATGYVQGIMRENFHQAPLDFHTSEFDNLGTQPIRRDELFADNGLANINGQGVATSTLAPNNILGFSPRYSEYKIGYDFLTGDFVVPSRRTGMDSYHMFRLFQNADSVIDPAFCIGEQTQYDRIFNNTSDEYDHMYVHHNIFIKAQRPMKSIAESIEFEDGGQELDIAAEGTTLN